MSVDPLEHPEGLREPLRARVTVIVSCALVNPPTVYTMGNLRQNLGPNEGINDGQ